MLAGLASYQCWYGSLARTEEQHVFGFCFYFPLVHSLLFRNVLYRYQAVLIVRAWFGCPCLSCHKYMWQAGNVVDLDNVLYDSVDLLKSMDDAVPPGEASSGRIAQRTVSSHLEVYKEKQWKSLCFFSPSFLPHLLPWEPAGSQMIVGSNWKLSPLLLKSFHKTLSYFIKSLNEFSRY